MSAFLRNLSIDFADTGEGGFYLSRKALADPSYQHVRKTMFSADGTATRLLVFFDGDKLGLDAAARAWFDTHDAIPLLRLVAEFNTPSASAPADFSAGLYQAVTCGEYPLLYKLSASPAQRRR